MYCFIKHLVKKHFFNLFFFLHCLSKEFGDHIGYAIFARAMFYHCRRWFNREIRLLPKFFFFCILPRWLEKITYVSYFSSNSLDIEVFDMFHCMNNIHLIWHSTVRCPFHPNTTKRSAVYPRFKLLPPFKHCLFLRQLSRP